MFNQDDRVIYRGNKFGELRTSVGYIVSRVNNQPGAYIVDFAGEGYVMPERVLAPYVPKKGDDQVAIMRPNRKKEED